MDLQVGQLTFINLQVWPLIAFDWPKPKTFPNPKLWSCEGISLPMASSADRNQTPGIKPGKWQSTKTEARDTDASDAGVTGFGIGWLVCELAQELFDSFCTPFTRFPLTLHSSLYLLCLVGSYEIPSFWLVLIIFGRLKMNRFSSILKIKFVPNASPSSVGSAGLCRFPFDWVIAHFMQPHRDFFQQRMLVVWKEKLRLSLVDLQVGTSLQHWVQFWIRNRKGNKSVVCPTRSICRRCWCWWQKRTGIPAILSSFCLHSARKLFL
jgi:hypothetical protein